MSKKFERLTKKWEDQQDLANSLIDSAPEEAIAAFRKCLDLASQMGKKGRIYEGLSLNNMAGALSHLEEYEKAAQVNEKAFEILKEEMPDDYELAGSALNCARLLCLAGRESESDPYFQEANRRMEIAVGPEHPAKARIYAARALVHTERPLPERIEDAKRAIDFALLDDYGDDLANAASEIAKFFILNDLKEEATEFLNRVLDRQKEIYSQPYEEVASNPGWVLDYGTARYVLLRKEYQEDDLEPREMRWTRLAIADQALRSDRLREARENMERLIEMLNQMNKPRAEFPKMDLAPFEMEDEEDLEEGAEELIEIEGESEEEIDPGFLLRHLEGDEEFSAIDDRAFLHHMYGVVLHALGHEESDRALLERAQANYQIAFEHLDSSPVSEEFREDLEANLRDVDADLKGAI